MIRLIVEDYCQDCPDFEPVAEKTNLYSGQDVCMVNTEVYCKYKDRCASVAKWMKEKEGKENVDSMP